MNRATLELLKITAERGQIIMPIGEAKRLIEKGYVSLVKETDNGYLVEITKAGDSYLAEQKE